ncbi:unannotated protein [freshwater metagenome]|uniref:Unannotated protein n=1 Tax=freshwater metagenome TaxID=449393 RepID=A0A6J7D873_9ZZZZ
MRGLRNENAVHAVRAGSQLASKPRRAERQARVKPVGQVSDCAFVASVGSADDRVEFSDSLWIRVLGEPRVRAGDQITRRHWLPLDECGDDAGEQR